MGFGQLAATQIDNRLPPAAGQTGQRVGDPPTPLVGRQIAHWLDADGEVASSVGQRLQDAQGPMYILDRG